MLRSCSLFDLGFHLHDEKKDKFPLMGREVIEKKTLTLIAKTLRSESERLLMKSELGKYVS